MVLASVTPSLVVDSSPGCLVDCNALLTVTDNLGESDSCSVMVTIIDSLDPNITCPADLTVEQTNADGTPVDLGNPTVSDICDADPEVMNDAPEVFPLGETIVTWTATDDCSNSLSCIQTVVVVDTTPPDIHSVLVSPNNLWPPNHQMVPVMVTCECEDICDIAPVCTIIYVKSSQPVNDTGDGDTEQDWMITGDLSVDLRAERSGNIKEGRIYIITIECTDFSGNSSTAAVNVVVPHDQGKKSGKSYQAQYYNFVTYYGLSPYNASSQIISITPVAQPQGKSVLPTLSVSLNNVDTTISDNNNNVTNMVVLKSNQGSNVSNSTQAKVNASFNYNKFIQSNPLAQVPGNFKGFDLFSQQTFFIGNNNWTFSGNNKLSLGDLLGNHWGWNQNLFKPKTNLFFGFSLDSSYFSLSVPSNKVFKVYPFQ